jgi:predicted RNA-binding protein with PUA domain
MFFGTAPYPQNWHTEILRESSGPKLHLPETCKQCGAPVTSIKCDYCGSHIREIVLTESRG